MDKKDIKTLVILTLAVIVIISFFVFGDIGKSKQEYVSYREEEKTYQEEEKASLITYMKVSNETTINKGTNYKYPHYYFVGELKNTYTKAVKGVMKATFYNGSTIVYTATIFLPNDGLSAGETFNFECSIGDENIKYTNVKYSDSSLRLKY